MGSSLDHLSSLEYDDVICLANGLETVCNDDDGSSFEQLIECDGDRLF